MIVDELVIGGSTVMTPVFNKLGGKERSADLAARTDIIRLE